jgi:hypothetical protein
MMLNSGAKKRQGRAALSPGISSLVEAERSHSHPGHGLHVVMAAGLIILAALIANGRIGYRSRLQFAGSGPMDD